MCQGLILQTVVCTGTERGTSDRATINLRPMRLDYNIRGQGDSYTRLSNDRVLSASRGMTGDPPSYGTHIFTVPCGRLFPYTNISYLRRNRCTLKRRVLMMHIATDNHILFVNAIQQAWRIVQCPAVFRRESIGLQLYLHCKRGSISFASVAMTWISELLPIPYTGVIATAYLVRSHY